MTEPASKTRLWWQISLRALIGVPIACAPVFLYVKLHNRVSPDERWARESDWVLNPVKMKFWPEEGTRVAEGGPPLKIAKVWSWWDGYHGNSWCVSPDGMIHNTWHSGTDAGSGSWPASTKGLVQLSTLLRKLPLSDTTDGPKERCLVAFPDKGYWVVRVYRGREAPKEVTDLAKTLGAWRD
jgi:hypothetical protein